VAVVVRAMAVAPVASVVALTAADISNTVGGVAFTCASYATVGIIDRACCAVVVLAEFIVSLWIVVSVVFCVCVGVAGVIHSGVVAVGIADMIFIVACIVVMVGFGVFTGIGVGAIVVGGAAVDVVVAVVVVIVVDSAAFMAVAVVGVTFVLVACVGAARIVTVANGACIAVFMIDMFSIWIVAVAVVLCVVVAVVAVVVIVEWYISRRWGTGGGGAGLVNELSQLVLQGVQF